MLCNNAQSRSFRTPKFCFSLMQDVPRGWAWGSAPYCLYASTSAGGCLCPSWPLIDSGKETWHMTSRAQKHHHLCSCDLDPGQSQDGTREVRSATLPESRELRKAGKECNFLQNTLQYTSSRPPIRKPPTLPRIQSWLNGY